MFYSPNFEPTDRHINYYTR